MDKIIVNKSRMCFLAGAAETSPAIYNIFTTRGLDPNKFINEFNTITADRVDKKYILIEFTFYNDGTYNFAEFVTSIKFVEGTKKTIKKQKEILMLKYMVEKETVEFNKQNKENLTKFYCKLKTGFEKGTLHTAIITRSNGDELVLEIGLKSCTIEICDKTERKVFGYRTGKRRKNIVDLNINSYPDNMLCTSFEMLKIIINTFVESGKCDMRYKWSKIVI